MEEAEGIASELGYPVVIQPAYAFEKFPGSLDRLSTQMRAVGEVMSIGKNFKEALQKAVRSPEIGRYGLGFAKDFHTKAQVKENG